MNKTLIPITEYALQFTDEEVEKFGWEPGQKFTVKLQDDDSIKLVPYEKLEIELDEYSREDLISLIQESCDKDVSVNEVIVGRLKRYLGQEMA